LHLIDPVAIIDRLPKPASRDTNKLDETRGFPSAGSPDLNDHEQDTTMQKQNYRRVIYILSSVFLIAGALNSVADGAYFLWDASRENMAGNADWVIDADRHAGQPPESDPDRFPSPDQSSVSGSTPESYWRGMNSEWAIRLVKAGHHVETLPRNATITYGSTTHAQDLSNYDVFILNEPQEPLFSAEKQAVFDFINAGGSVLMIADHCGSDRNHSGWDSPRVFNDMDIETEFGVIFYDDSMPYECDFTQNIFRVNDDPSDPVIHGPFGTVTRIKFNGTTEIEIIPSVNPTLTGHAWRNPGSPGSNRYMVVTGRYGNGKVAFVPDSSPSSDGTGDPYDTSYGNTFADPEFENDYMFLNLSAWLAEGAPPHPTPTPGGTPTATPTPGDLHGVDLILNKTRFSEGDDFLFAARCGNQGSGLLSELYIVLDVGGRYWFYPGWTDSPMSETHYLGSGSIIELTIMEFIWPAVDGFAYGLRFWGALLTPENQLLGDYDMIEWGYE